MNFRASPVVQQVKNACNAGDTGNVGSVPGSGRSPGEGSGNPLQYSCWENPMNRRTQQTTAHGVAELDTVELITAHVDSRGRLLVHNRP